MQRSRLASATTYNSSSTESQASDRSRFWLPLLTIGSSLLVVAIWVLQQSSIGQLNNRIDRLGREIARLPNSVAAIERLNLQKEQLKLERDRLGIQNSLYNLVFEGIGVILLGGLVYGGWQYLRRTEAQLQTTREQQVTDRFNQAIVNLASDKLEVRLGGIYALERLSQESPSEYWMTIEILTAFVRERSTLAPEPSPPLVGVDIPKQHRKPSVPRIPTDVQAVMTMLSRRDLSRDLPDRPIELRGSNLRAADLNGIELSGADLWKVNLREAQLWQAKLAGASFGRANLSDASLWQADLEGAYLWKANLEGANLSEANLASANLEDANLKAANLHQTNLIAADLRKVVGLTHAQLSGAICNETTQLPDYIEAVSGEIIS
jgi:Tfp pilus assembly protein PilN